MHFYLLKSVLASIVMKVIQTEADRADETEKHKQKCSVV
mgnify:CR=1 FL=1